METRARARIGLILVLVPLAAASAQWTRTTLRIKDKTISVELARTRAEHELGLMFRDSLPTDEGMLFVFAAPEKLSFWMKNTKVPLSIAFLGADGAIRQIEDMEPFSTDPVPSKDECQYALEMNRGWFRRNGVGVGDRLDRGSLGRVRPAAPATR